MLMRITLAAGATIALMAAVFITDAAAQTIYFGGEGGWSHLSNQSDRFQVPGAAPVRARYDEGFAVGALIAQAVNLAARTHYLSKLFDGFSMLRHTGRAVAPMIPAVGVVLLTRMGATGDRTLGRAVAEFVLFAFVTVAATAVFERALLREVFGYLRRAR